MRLRGAFLSVILCCMSLLAHAQSDVGSLSEMLLQQGRYEEAHRSLIDYIAQYRDSDDCMAAATNNLGECMVGLKQFKTAERYYLRSYSLYQKLYAERPEEYVYFVARSQHNLGSLYYQMEQYAQSREYLALSLYQREKLFAHSPSDFAVDLVQTLNSTAALYSIQQQYKDAEKYYKRAIDRLKIVNNPDLETRMVWAMTYNNMAILYRQKSQPRVAESYYQKAIEIYESVYEIAPSLARPQYAVSLANLVNLYQFMGKDKKAKEYEAKIDLL